MKFPVSVGQANEELIEQFTRVISQADSIHIEALIISWDGPCTPVSSWLKVYELPANASEFEIKKSRKKLIGRKKYFRICDFCGEQHPDGYMFTNHMCQTCASTHMGVVF